MTDEDRVCTLIAVDFHTTMLNQTLREGLDEIASALQDIESSGLGRSLGGSRSNRRDQWIIYLKKIALESQSSSSDQRDGWWRQRARWTKRRREFHPRTVRA